MAADTGGPASWDPAAVRTRVAELARLDPQYARFGAGQHRYRLAPPLPAAELHAFEALHGVELPASYRDFVLRVADGGAGPRHGLFPLTGPGAYPGPPDGWAAEDVRESDRRPGALATPFPFTEAWRPRPGERFDPEAMTAGTLAIAEAGCGEFIRLVVTGAQRGRVWSADLEVWPSLTPGPDFGDWYAAWLADTPGHG
ncbi:SMI1/KNR4 family protein [Streptomyces albofaciens JCM 4342]|uniref:SMI1/KNR4 family protein n=1 Tax=Streptomyces albofaciens TaxID=66866 RepID=UPI00123AD3CF|nr:SMI1/KNR4 family protein [Streptomyces albofaciens]KAA6221012.1 SMI1/KNR4 family protein [Streptomyces albofaciens JCM 4342]